MKRFASTRSEKRDSQPGAGRAQWSVDSIDDDGIRYGFTTQALIASTIATAPTIVTIQSTVIRSRRGKRPVTRSSGWWKSWWVEPSSSADGGGIGQENGGAGGGGERYSLGIRQSSALSRGTSRSSVSLTGGSPVRERGGAWGTGRFPTIARRRGRAGETWFPPGPRAEGERCSRSEAPHVLTPPRFDTSVVAGQEDLGHRPAAEFGGPRVVGVLETAVERVREALHLA